MASQVTPDGSDPATYRGLPSIFEYINWDGDQRRFNCGQAAACTFLARYHLLTADADLAQDAMIGIEATDPPDNFGGWFGTSRRRVERICATRGLPVEEVGGEEELRQRLADRRPVMVMLGTEGKALFAGLHAPTGHWMVAYGYDDYQIFLTNYHTPGMPWDEFRMRWNSFVPRLISMRRVGLAAATLMATEDAPPAPVIV